jgi:DNA-binding HxlR family transcriptional regulator
MALTFRKRNLWGSAVAWEAQWVTLERMSTQPKQTSPAEVADVTAADFEGCLEFAFDVMAVRCPSRPVLEHVTGRWGSLVLIALRRGPSRFNELRRLVSGVSEKMLSQSLHALERDGIVVREVHSTIPPRVEYSLTPLGEQTADKLWEFVVHLENSMPSILTAQQDYDSAASA